MTRQELQKSFEQRFNETKNFIKYFKASEWQKVLHYPLRITLAKILNKMFPVTIQKSIIKQKLFDGRNFFTEGYYLDYFRCGYITEDNEVRMTRYMISHFPDNGTFFDIGAHYGFYSLLAKDISPIVKIYCFEPSPSTFKILSRNIEQTDITTNKFALSSSNKEDGHLAVFKDHSLAGSNSLYADEAVVQVHSNNYDTVIIQTKTLDSFCDENGVNPTILKIDVEGSEADVITGGRQTISRCKPEIIIEVWPVGYNDRHIKALKSLEEIGYSFYKMLENGELLSADILNIKDYPGTENIVCRHSSIIK
jgi:FkbM family methyltransferase